MGKSYSFHPVNVPANHVVTIEFFINEGCTTTKQWFFCVLYILNTNISNVTKVVGNSVVTLQ